MDTKAYLIRQGWPGPGNPLNPTRSPGSRGGLGLTKPILVARKQNTLGIGKKTTHDNTNQWWLRNFEAALRAVGDNGSATPTSEESNSVSQGKSELYRFFVKGEGLAGTIDSVWGSHIVELSKRQDHERTNKMEGEKVDVKFAEEARALRREVRRKSRKLAKSGNYNMLHCESVKMDVEAELEARQQQMEEKPATKRRVKGQTEQQSTNSDSLPREFPESGGLRKHGLSDKEARKRQKSMRETEKEEPLELKRGKKRLQDPQEEPQLDVK